MRKMEMHEYPCPYKVQLALACLATQSAALSWDGPDHAGSDILVLRLESWVILQLLHHMDCWGNTITVEITKLARRSYLKFKNERRYHLNKVFLDVVRFYCWPLKCLLSLSSLADQSPLSNWGCTLMMLRRPDVSFSLITLTLVKSNVYLQIL